MNYDKSKYDRGKSHLVTQPILYVEGNTSKIFYQQLIELQDKFVENGGSCSAIKIKVKNDTTSFGIIDSDYSIVAQDRIFPIDYYSIENISLVHITELIDLKKSLINYVLTYKLSKVRLYKTIFDVFRDENNRVKEYKINLGAQKHHSQYNSYIANNIVCEMTFLRYKDLKTVVEKYVKFHKSMYSEKINYISELADYLPSKSIKEIFNSHNLERLEKTFELEIFR